MSNKFLPFRHEDAYILVGDVLATLVLEAIDYEMRGQPDVGKLVEQENMFRREDIPAEVGDYTYGWVLVSPETLIKKYFNKESKTTIWRKLKLLREKDLILYKEARHRKTGGGQSPDFYRVNLRNYIDGIHNLHGSPKHGMWSRLGLLNATEIEQEKDTGEEVSEEAPPFHF